jgi:Anti-sigma factor NepR
MSTGHLALSMSGQEGGTPSRLGKLSVRFLCGAVDKPTDNGVRTVALLFSAASAPSQHPSAPEPAAVLTKDNELGGGHEWLTCVSLCPIPAPGKWGEMLVSCRGAGIPASGITLVGMARRPRAGLDFEAVRTAIGTALRSLHANVLREPLPDRMVELLRQLDQPPNRGQETDNA